MATDRKFEYWKKCLLDLGRGNRLIHCALPKSGSRVSRTSLLFDSPAPGEWWKRLAEGTSELQFLVPEEGAGEGQSFQNGIRTNQSPRETIKTLHALMKKAKEFHEEKGLNALYLAFGFLNWQEAGKNGQELRSPLLLIPVSLSQESLNDPIVLSRYEEEISVNTTLEQRLSNDFGITLPAFTEESDWQAYLSQVKEVCSKQKWTVDQDTVQLSMFSFLKINMYRDLIRHSAQITVHPLVRALKGELVDLGELGRSKIKDIGGYQHDAVEPREVFSVVDADSSQQDAILLAKRGVSFVLQGPPGTGKSQTITNIIAELIADGKKVLFVSEKMAALEVVHKRLTQAGLGPFCLTLHSHNVKRREILDQLEVSLKLSRQKAELQQEAFKKLTQLKQTRAALNDYVKELHTVVRPLGQTIYQVNGYLASDTSGKNIDFIQKNADSFTQEMLLRCVSALEEMARIVDKSGYQQDNPWNGCVLTDVTYEFRQKFLADSEKIRTLLSDGVERYGQMMDLLGLRNVKRTLTRVDEAGALFAIAEHSPGVPFEWLRIDLANQLAHIDACMALVADMNELSVFCQELGEHVGLLGTYDEAWDHARQELLSVFDEEVLNIDAASMASRYRTEYRSGLARMLKGQYKKDQKQLLGFYKNAAKMPYENALAFLGQICSAIELRDNYKRQTDLVKDCLKNMAEKSGGAKEKSVKHDNRMEKSAKKTPAKRFQMDLADYETLLCRKKKTFETLSKQLSRALSEEIREETNLAELKSRISWAVQWKEKAGSFALGEGFVRNICSHNPVTLENWKAIVDRMEEWKGSVMPEFSKFSKLFEEPVQKKLLSLDLKDLSEFIKVCGQNLASLEYLIDYRNAERTIRSLKIDHYLAKAKELNLKAEEIVPVFEKCFYRSWLDLVMPKFPAVSSFRWARQEWNREQFMTLDQEHLKISQAALVSKLIARLPNFDSFSGSGGEIALLRHEMAKRRKLMPTRKLLAAIPNLLPHIKPCMMMSPLSVSTYLGNSNWEFDTVIFDEASQVRTEDAICSIFRAKQAIIAGDSKQLPPTNFFVSSFSDSGDFEEDEDGAENDAGAYESLLDEASMLPTQTLLWHYRSKHEHLISFSNAKIYGGNLITFPSSVEKAEGMGVEYIHVPDGRYAWGGKSGNQQEAERVAELVFEHFDISPQRSIGVIAFGNVQQAAIEEAILRRRRKNPKYERFFKDSADEALFVKNLETVQGDERDTILLSIGYAPDANGKFVMRFGPLSYSGGERRLNVAITRARYNLKLVGSILPSDIDLERTGSEGIKLLRQYLDFAIHGQGVLLGETNVSGAGWQESSFESAVYHFLTSQGFDVAAQIGCSNYKVDLAVRDPKDRGRFAVGIECDGMSYRLARTARERDRLRESILGAMGWKMKRVWSTDWIKDPRTQGERLLSEVRSAMAAGQKRMQQISSSRAASKGPDFLEVSEKSETEIANEKYRNVRSRYAGKNANEIPPEDFRKTMLRVLAANFGLDKAGLFKETAQYGYLWSRQGGTIKQRLETAYGELLSRGEMAEEDGKVRIVGK